MWKGDGLTGVSPFFVVGVIDRALNTHADLADNADDDAIVNNW